MILTQTSDGPVYLRVGLPTTMDTPRLSLTREQVQRIKDACLRGRPYADRVSLSLCLRLRSLWKDRADYHPVLDELDFLERLRPASRTKRDARFGRGPVRFLFHKHYCTPRDISRNLAIHWKHNLEEEIAAVARVHGDAPDHWPAHLAYRIVAGGFEARRRRGLTGEWIIFARHAERNYYLSLATHADGRAPERLLDRLCRECEAEFPFLFAAPWRDTAGRP